MRANIKLTSGIAGLAFLLLPAGSWAQTASLLPNGQQQFSDANGAPYAAGTVGFYAPNTLTPKTVWQDPNQATPLTNPVTLDSAGRATIYGVGQYRQRLFDLNGTLVWDKLTNATDWGNVNITGGSIANTNITGGTITGATIVGSSAVADGISVKAHGAVCDGAVDDSAAFATTDGLTTGSVLVGAGLNCRIGTNVTVGHPIQFSPGAKVTISNAVTLSLGSTPISVAGAQIFAGGGTASFATGDGRAIYSSWWGPDPTGLVDSVAAWRAFFVACNSKVTNMPSTSGGRRCYLDAGNYLLNDDLVWDYGTNIAGGANIQGAGNNATLLNFASGKHMTIQCTCTSTGGALFYPTISNFGVQGTYSSGGMLTIGQNPTAGGYPDAFNGMRIDTLYVKNLASSVNSAGLVLNQFVDGVVTNVTTSDGCADSQGYCPAGGDSLRLVGTAFTHFVGGSFSGAKVGVHITTNGAYASSGFNFGNVFTATNVEVVCTDVLIDSDSSARNTWIGGTYVNASDFGHNDCFRVDSTATGTEAEVFDNNNIGGAASWFNGSGHNYGLLFRTPTETVNSPSVPATTVKQYNETARRVSITVQLGSATQICVGNTDPGTCFDYVGTGTEQMATFTLLPKQFIDATYIGTAPAWLWSSIE